MHRLRIFYQGVPVRGEGAAVRAVHPLSLLHPRFSPWQCTGARWSPPGHRASFLVDFLLGLSGRQKPQMAETHIYKLKLSWF